MIFIFSIYLFIFIFIFFFFNDTATTEIYTLSLHDALPICYTSADSVFQVAAHEMHFGLERLYGVCAVAKELTEPLNIGRVIARPFVGDGAQGFRRTTNRRDLT